MFLIVWGKYRTSNQRKWIAFGIITISKERRLQPIILGHEEMNIYKYILNSMLLSQKKNLFRIREFNQNKWRLLTLVFSGVNSKGMFGLSSGVSRWTNRLSCCRVEVVCKALDEARHCKIQLYQNHRDVRWSVKSILCNLIIYHNNAFWKWKPGRINVPGPELQF